MTDKERRFWEKCGFKILPEKTWQQGFRKGSRTRGRYIRYLDPNGRELCLLPNVNSLDDLMKYGWPVAEKKITKDTGLQPHQAKRALVIRWMERWVGDKPPAQALYEALCQALEVEG